MSKDHSEHINTNLDFIKPHQRGLYFISPRISLRSSLQARIVKQCQGSHRYILQVSNCYFLGTPMDRGPRVFSQLLSAVLGCTHVHIRHDP